MNRRFLLAGGGAVGAALSAAAAGATAVAAQAAPANPDAALIALADRYPAALAALNAYTGPDDTPEEAALREEVLRIFHAVLTAQPTTLTGLAAKARVSHADSILPSGEAMPPDEGWDRMARSVCDDLRRLTGATYAAPATQAPSPDAALIAACEAHEDLVRAAFPGDGDEDDDSPEYAAWRRCNDVVCDTEPQTMAGVLALARAAKRSATRPDGSAYEQGFTSDASAWAWGVMEGLCRLMPG